MAQIYRVTGVVDKVPYPEREKRLKFLHEAVGGYIEGVALRGGKYMYVNEEGLMLGLDPNYKASKLAGIPIVGNAVVLSADEAESDRD